MGENVPIRARVNRRIQKALIMPYKDPKDPRNIAQRKAYYERTRAGRYERTKHNIYKWRESHPEKYEYLKKEYYADHKNDILERQKKSYYKNIDKRHAAEKKRVEDLTDVYLKKQLIKLGYTRKNIRQNPELIEILRNQTKLKRLIKQKKNGNSRTKHTEKKDS